MANRLLTAFSTAVRRQAARRWLLEQGPAERLILAPSRGAADDLVRDGELPPKGLFGVHRLTLTRYAVVVAAEALADRDRVPVGRLGEEALVARISHRAAAEDRLNYFTPVVNLPGFPRALAATLQELRLQGVSAAGLEAGGAAGADLAELLKAFRAELEEQSLADMAMILELARSVVAGESAAVVRGPLLLFDLPLRTRLERNFVETLAGCAPGTMATLTARNLEAVAQLETVLQCEAELADEPPPGAGLQRIRRSLFDENADLSVEDGPGFEFFSAAGEGREAVEVARAVLRKAADGIAFDRIAVFVRNAELYQPQLQDAFRRGGVPAYFSRGTRRPDPAGRAFLALLSCALEGLSATRFAEYLSLGQVPDVDEDGAPPSEAVPWVEATGEQQLTFITSPEADAAPEADPVFDADAPVIDGNLKAPLYWESLLVDAAVIGGRDRWKRRLDGLQEELRLKLDQVPEQDWQQAMLGGQLQRLAHLKAFALPMIDTLAELPGEARWGDWLESLRELATKGLRSPESVLEVLAELEPMAEVGPVGLSEVCEALRDRLLLLRREPPRHRYGRVFVGTAEESAGRSFAHVFLAGVSEGIFPRRVGEDPLLLDELRREIDPALTTRKERAADERGLLQGIVEAAEEQLSASYSRLDVAQGRGRVPSLYALELVRTAEGRIPELRRLEGRRRQRTSRLGWPAPAEPRQAVDAAEFDLATLRPILEGQQDPAGRGRFLLEVNPILARSLRVRYKRWMRRWTDVDGIVALQQPDVLEILQSQRLAQRSYSPTALQSFSACPFRFFLYAVVRLQPREEAVAIERMDPLLRGSLFHDVQFELFRHWREAGRLPLDESRLDQLLSDADAVLNRVAGEYEERVAPALPSVWKGELESLRIDLRSWVREMVAAGGRWQPVHFEFAFGLAASADRDPASVEEPARLENGMLLRGSIDLVERSTDGETLRVTDHKTGRAPSPEPRYVGGGAVLQPLIYAMAAERLLQSRAEEGRLYYCTQRGGFRQYVIPADAEARSRLVDVLEIIDGSIEHGFLPAAPAPGACRYCDYRAVCGPYEELRAGRKEPSPLGAVDRLRRIP